MIASTGKERRRTSLSGEMVEEEMEKGWGSLARGGRKASLPVLTSYKRLPVMDTMDSMTKQEWMQHTFAVQEIREKPHSFHAKMYKSRDKASKAPTPESWEEFKQFLPEELKQTLGGQDFCPFVCDAEMEKCRNGSRSQV